MVDDEPTQPNLRAQKTGGAPAWPLPQPQRAEERHIWRGVLLFLVVALLSFGVVRGVTIVLAQHHDSITVPSLSPGAPTGVPVATSPASTVTPAAAPTETAEPTPTSGGGD